MNKTMKGAIAAGAAALLLAGGTGTMAAWKSGATLGGGTVTSGHLRITENGAGTWTWEDGAAFDPATDRIVPGDVVEYTGTYTLEVEGTNLVAALTSDLGAADATEFGQWLIVDTTAGAGGIDVNNITEANDGATVGITTTITFDPNTPDQEAMDATASLADSAITLEQTAPASNP